MDLAALTPTQDGTGGEVQNATEPSLGGSECDGPKTPRKTGTLGVGVQGPGTREEEKKKVRHGLSDFCAVFTRGERNHVSVLHTVSSGVISEPWV